MKNEKTNKIVILPNPNQLILLRDIQKEICMENKQSLPILPLCVKSDCLKTLGQKITQVSLNSIEKDDDGIFFIFVQLETDGKTSVGKLLLCTPGKSPAFSETFLADITEKLKKIGKLSPFRIAKIETEEYEKGTKWKILEEKWCKLK